MATLIFCKTETYRNQQSVIPIFTFTSTQNKQVLKHIQENLSDYFDYHGINSMEDEFDLFKEQVEEEGLLNAISNSTTIQATYLELESIATTKKVK